MRKRNSIFFGALLAIAMALPAMGEPVPWPEAHSGAYLGVQIAEVTPQEASAWKLQDQGGAVITYVDQDGPACHAGLVENDVVIAFNGSKVDSAAQLQGLIHASVPQKPITLTIVHSGQRKDVKVTLGSWNVMSHARAFTAMNLGSPPPPHAITPDLEIPSFTVLSARHGLVVESLSPQLADYFGVTRGQGVLVRSVEGGSPAASAGIKAGDVIVKVNNEVVHDMVDWQRGMHGHTAKISVTIWRDKHEQTVVLTVPGPDETSQLQPGDWLDFDTQAQALRDQVQQMQPEIERSQAEIAQLKPSDKDMEQMRREIEKSMNQNQKQIDKMSRDMAKSMKPAAKEMEQMQHQLQQSMKDRQKEFEAMSRQMAATAMPTQEQMNELRHQIQSSMPSQQDLETMRRQIEDSMKNLTPQMQEQMKQMQKQMEQQKLDLQEMMKGFNPSPEF
jgi:serine protease Do